jgi:hypothetical protein
MARRGTTLKKPNNQKHVELRGKARAADLDGRQFSLRLDDETKVVAEFTTEQERQLLRRSANTQVADRGLRLKPKSHEPEG